MSRVTRRRPVLGNGMKRHAVLVLRKEVLGSILTYFLPRHNGTAMPETQACDDLLCFTGTYRHRRAQKHLPWRIDMHSTSALQWGPFSVITRVTTSPVSRETANGRPARWISGTADRVQVPPPPYFFSRNRSKPEQFGGFHDAQGGRLRERTPNSIMSNMSNACRSWCLSHGRSTPTGAPHARSPFRCARSDKLPGRGGAVLALGLDLVCENVFDS